MIEVIIHKNGNNTVTKYDDSYIPTNFDSGTDYESVVKLDNPYSYTINNKNSTGWVLMPKTIEPEKKYPVLYLLHGLGNPAYQEWVVQGNIQQIIGNLILKNQIQPMIVVMPDVITDNTESQGERMSQFKSFINVMKPADGSKGLIDYINQNYPVSEDVSKTSIGGISYGGLIALYIACVYQNLFYSVGGFSPSFGLVPNGLLKSDLDFKFGNGHDHLVFIGRGDSDTTVNKNPDSYKNILNKNGNDNIFCTLPGGHNWIVFKNLLYVFLQNKIFV